MNTASFIKTSRADLGLTQKQLSEIIKKDRTNISLYETGKTIPPGDVVLTLIKLRFPEICLSNSHQGTSENDKKQGVSAGKKRSESVCEPTEIK